LRFKKAREQGVHAEQPCTAEEDFVAVERQQTIVL
jgi:hypothetical protein